MCLKKYEDHIMKKDIPTYLHVAYIDEVSDFDRFLESWPVLNQLSIIFPIPIQLLWNNQFSFIITSMDTEIWNGFCRQNIWICDFYHVNNLSYYLSSLLKKCAPQLQNLTRLPKVVLKSVLMTKLFNFSQKWEILSLTCPNTSSLLKFGSQSAH